MKRSCALDWRSSETASGPDSSEAGHPTVSRLGRQAWAAPYSSPLQRAQKVQHLLLLGGTEREEVRRHLARFRTIAAMSIDR